MRSVLITGCSSGIGRALADEFRRRNVMTIPSARSPAAVEALRRDGFEPVTLDVNDGDSVERAVAEAWTRSGGLDLLLNNAGLAAFGPLAEMPAADLRALFETNLLGPLALVQALAPRMAERRRGRIVNVGSLVGVVGTPFTGGYSASKAALHMLTDVLRMELGPFGVDVGLLLPGAVRSDVAAKSLVARERYAAEDSLYRPVRGSIERRARASQQAPMEAATFARRVVPRLCARRLPREIRVGAGVALLPLLERLPGAWRDGLFARRFGLRGLGRRGGG